MTRRPTLHDVAERAGVSIKTVSRVVNGVDSVSPDRKARVDEAVAELGYVPNDFARSLKRGSVDTIGVIIDSIADPFFAAMAHAIEERSALAGLNVLIGSTGFVAERERRQVERMAMQRVDGLVLAPVTADHSYLEAYRASFPVVLVDRSIEHTGYDLVSVADRQITRDAIEHLIAHGHRRIAFVGRDERFPTTRERLGGYQDAMRVAGVPIDPAWTPPGLTDERDAEQAVNGLLALPQPPTAIFAANPRVGAGVVHELHTTGRQDVAFISFGDFPLARTLRPAVTFVDQDPAAIGLAAIERILTHLDAAKRRAAEPQVDIPEDEPRTIVVETSLVTRGSGEVTP